MSGRFFNLSLLALIVGMAIYHGRLYDRYRLAYRLAFFAFWLLLGVELVSEDRWLLIPATTCLVYGIWRRRRFGRDLERMMKGDGSAGEAIL